MEQIIYNSLPPNSHFPLHLSSCGGGAPEQGGGERKGTLTGSRGSGGGGGGPAAARELPGPCSAGPAAAGLSGRRRRRRRGTRAHGRGTRPGGGQWWLAPLLSPPRRLALPSVPGLRIQSTPPPPLRINTPIPCRSPTYPNSTHCALDPPRAPCSALCPSCLHTRTLKTFILFLERGERYLGDRETPASEAGRWGPACSSGGGPLPSSLQARELSPCLHF